MEFLLVGDQINIKRSDGCMHTAIVCFKNIEEQLITVEWTQDSKVKGKEIAFRTVLEFNPNLSQNKPSESQERLSTDLNMYRKKLPNNMYKKRSRILSRCEKVMSSANVDKQQQNKSTAQMLVSEKNMPERALLKPNLVPISSMPCSNVVREVERMKEKRELRRAMQDEKRREKSALANKDPGNPNWQVALMVCKYRDQLILNPLRSLSPHGARVQQITVCVRKRPMNRRELQAKAVDIISVPGRNSLIVHELRHKVDLTKILEHHKFRFDYTFDEQCNNALVYDHTARPLIRTMFEGGNATCFAYGQTGSGKTHTMGGEFCGKTQDCTTGIYAMAARDVFLEMSKAKYRKMGASITCSYFEIYSSKVYDLLLPEKPQLRVLEDGRQQVVIVGLTRMPVRKVEDVLRLIEQGNRERTSGQTSVNIKSSRSHAVFQMCLIMPGDSEPCGKCSFVDLAGNERGADTQTASLQTRREGAEINKSLLALKECIRALSRHSSHLPFRGSKLTQVLRDSFVGGKQNKTCMIAMISPGLSSVENTLNTLRYADRVKELVAKEVDHLETSGDGEVSCNVEYPCNLPNSQKAPDETNDEICLNHAESIIEYKESESESDDSEGDIVYDIASSPASDINSDVDGQMKDNELDIPLAEVLIQHNLLFQFFHQFKMNFDDVTENETKVKNNADLLKFLINAEPSLSELETLVKNTRLLVANYNSMQYFESENDQVPDNLDK